MTGPCPMDGPGQAATNCTQMDTTWKWKRGRPVNSLRKTTEIDTKEADNIGNESS